jgi:hypothetical protein
LYEDDDNEHEIEVAEREAAAALPDGWGLHYPDGERFRLPGASLQTYGLTASGPRDEAVLVVAVGKANAYHQLARRLRGELAIAEAWAPPVPPVPPERSESDFLGPYGDDAEVEQALDELTDALPDGWRLYDVDRERFRVPGGKVEAFGVSAVGPGGTAAVVLAVGEANAYRQLARRLRGELEVAEAWAPPLSGVARR